MEAIELPVNVATGSDQTLLLPARIGAFVSLDNENAKGIHMSRLYLSLKEGLANKTLSFSVLSQLLDEFVVKQEGLSQDSYLDVEFELPVERKALLSGQVGWRHYAVKMFGQLKGA
ncbi:MAG: GTP cyclohydrolase, FolE2/MptA family [Bdellovibrionales bacterium]